MLLTDVALRGFSFSVTGLTLLLVCHVSQELETDFVNWLFSLNLTTIFPHFANL